jgi:hypothetical protein
MSFRVDGEAGRGLAWSERPMSLDLKSGGIDVDDLAFVIDIDVNVARVVAQVPELHQRSVPVLHGRRIRGRRMGIVFRSESSVNRFSLSTACRVAHSREVGVGSSESPTLAGCPPSCRRHVILYTPRRERGERGEGIVNLDVRS